MNKIQIFLSFLVFGNICLTLLSIETGKYYVIKEVDTSNMTTEQALLAIEEIAMQGTIRSRYVGKFP